MLLKDFYDGRMGRQDDRCILRPFDSIHPVNAHITVILVNELGGV